MSAIWGIVDFGLKNIAEEEKDILKAPFLHKRIELFRDAGKDNYYLGVGVQFVNKEAEREGYPYIRDGKCFVADAIVDNRQEIVKEFELKNELSVEGIDGSILFEAVNKDMSKALDALCGAFVFAQYDENSNTLLLANDACGIRSVYYTFADGKIVFSSLLKPIVPFLEKVEVNEEWIKLFVEYDDLRICNNPLETPYRGIYRLEPGEVLFATKEGIKRNGYWNPLKRRKTLRLKSDKEYCDLFNDVYKRCVESVIRDGSNTGIMLSGGLDSNSVVAYAAPYLKQRGRKLYSYTSVPTIDKKPLPNQYYVDDERVYVEKVLKRHDNIIPNYICTEGCDIVEENRRYQRIIETPVKTMANVPWMIKLSEAAAKDGCRVLLSGQSGNITVSYGQYDNLFATLKAEKRFVELLFAVNAFCKIFRISRKKILKMVLINDTSGEAIKRSRSYMCDKCAFRQISEAEQQESLETGVIHRDPTRDKRLVELAMSLPLKQFVRSDCDRRLVRVYMKGLIPDEIALETRHKGAQGTGEIAAIRSDWNNIKEKIKDLYKLPRAKEFVDINQLSKKIGDIDKDSGNFEYVKAVYMGLLCEYLEGMYEK